MIDDGAEFYAKGLMGAAMAFDGRELCVSTVVEQWKVLCSMTFPACCR